MNGREYTVNNFKFQISNFKLRWGWVLACFLIIVIVFFLLRIINLTILPVFADEAIYIRWAQVMRAEPTLRFLPLSDGKQPLFMWLVIPFFKLITDPLAAGRAVSILAGFGTLIGLFLLTFTLFKSKASALLSSLLYAIVPFTVFFDRMALADSLLSMFGVWTLYFASLLAIYRRLDLAMITGMILGGALLTKSPAIFFSFLIPLTVIFLFPAKSKNEFLVQLIKLILLWLVVYLIAYAIYNIQRLGPNFSMISARNADYVFPISHAFTNPLDPLKFHLVEIWQWFSTLLTWPVWIAGLFGIFIGLRRNFKPSLVLFLWFFIPLMTQAELAKVFTARYLLYVVPIFLIFSAVAFNTVLQKFNSKFISFVFIITLLVLPLKFDYLLLTDPTRVSLPKRERSGYLEEWTAGTGIKEAAIYLKEQAKDKKILVGTEGYFGTLPDGLQMYLEGVPNITIIGIGLYLEKVPTQLLNALVNNQVYLLINDERLSLQPENEGLTLLAKYPKAARENGTNQSLLLLLVNPR